MKFKRIILSLFLSSSLFAAFGCSTNKNSCPAQETKSIYSTGSSQESYFEYEYDEANDYYVITGVTEEHLNEKELYIPIYHQGKKVMGSSYYFFNNCLKVEKVVYPETFDFVRSFQNSTVHQVVLPRYLRSLMATDYYRIPFNVVWPETCQEIGSIDYTGITTLDIPYGITEFAIPKSCYFLCQLTISSTVQKLTKEEASEENESLDLPNLMEVYNLSPYITDDQIKTLLPKVKIIHHSKEEESYLVKENGIWFYFHSNDVFPLIFDRTENFLIFPNKIKGRYYEIRSYHFVYYRYIPSIVLPTDISKIEENSFYHFNCSSVFFCEPAEADVKYKWFDDFSNAATKQEGISPFVTTYWDCNYTWEFISGIPYPCVYETPSC